MQCAKLKTYMETGRVVFLPARSIRPNPAQPRRTFEENALSELTESIRCHGVIQPLSVRRVEGSYELIAGERRLRAAQAAGLGEIPCIIMTMDDTESSLAALVENLQRQDLDFLEEAEGIARLIRTQNLSQDQAARLLGKSQSAIANKLRILRHSPQVLTAIRQGGLSERHARALLRLKSEGAKLSAIRTITALRMSVSRTEQYIDSLLAEGSEKKPARVNLGGFLNNLSQSLARIQAAGVAAVSERRETEAEIVLTITIPKYSIFPFCRARACPRRPGTMTACPNQKDSLPSISVLRDDPQICSWYFWLAWAIVQPGRRGHDPALQISFYNCCNFCHFLL